MIALWAVIGILVVIGGAAAYVVACREAIAALDWKDEE